MLLGGLGHNEADHALTLTIERELFQHHRVVIGRHSQGMSGLSTNHAFG